MTNITGSFWWVLLRNPQNSHKKANVTLQTAIADNPGILSRLLKKWILFFGFGFGFSLYSLFFWLWRPRVSHSSRGAVEMEWGECGSKGLVKDKGDILLDFRLSGSRQNWAGEGKLFPQDKIMVYVFFTLECTFNYWSGIFQELKVFKGILLLRSYQKLLWDFLTFYHKTEREPVHRAGLKGKWKKKKVFWFYSDEYNPFNVTHDDVTLMI